MGDMHDTQFITLQENTANAAQVLEQVYIALTEKGYNPVNQIVGYIMSGDPTYITSHKNARSLIMKVSGIYSEEEADPVSRIRKQEISWRQASWFCCGKF